MNGPIILDGRRLADRLRPQQRARVERVAAARGRPPAVHIVGFGEAARPPRFVERKLAACEAAGVVATARIIGFEGTSADVIAAMRSTPADADGLFLEFPYPRAVTEADVLPALPVALDVDVMTPERVRAFFEGKGAPPVTVAAALALIDDARIDVRGMRGVTIAERSPFTEMLNESFARRGAAMSLVAPSDGARARGAGLVIVAAAQPGLVHAADLGAGSVVIDVGYFNPGGRGDVDVEGGVGHLGALAPVPGGIGPATIAMLVERVIEFAEAEASPLRG